MRASKTRQDKTTVHGTGEPVPWARERTVATAKLRWKPVGQDESVRREQSVVDAGTVAGSEDHRFAAAVAALGLKLSNDPHTKDMTFMQLRAMAVQAAGDNAQRLGLLELVDFAKAVLGED